MVGIKYALLGGCLLFGTGVSSLAALEVLLCFYHPHLYQSTAIESDWPTGRPRVRAQARTSWPGLTGLDSTWLHGSYRTWHKNGELESEGYCVDGARTGTWRFYYPDGTQQSSGEYTAGGPGDYWHHVDLQGRAHTSAAPLCAQNKCVWTGD
jgi:hypothetical protein